jgi:hypothetical protein
MFVEIVIAVALTVVALLLWRLIAILTLAVNNQIDQTTRILEELQLIRAGLFAMTKIDEEAGWPGFEKLSRYIVESYILPAKFTSLRAV